MKNKSEMMKKYNEIIKILEEEKVSKIVTLTIEQLTKVLNRAIEITECSIMGIDYIRPNYKHINESTALKLVDMTLCTEEEDETDE